MIRAPAAKADKKNAFPWQGHGLDNGVTHFGESKTAEIGLTVRKVSTCLSTTL